MPTRRKSVEAIRAQQACFLAFFGAIVALVVLTVAAGDTKPPSMELVCSFVLWQRSCATLAGDKRKYAQICAQRKGRHERT